tara:strand:+ start:547 stop:720 length:174 start_codon:yes stop_codon:yes gene_type:complete
MSYKKTKHQLPNKTWAENPNIILRIVDGAYIPVDPDNTDYQAYLAWVAEGNTAEAAD